MKTSKTSFEVMNRDQSIIPKVRASIQIPVHNSEERFRILDCIEKYDLNGIPDEYREDIKIFLKLQRCPRTTSEVYWSIKDDTTKLVMILRFYDTYSYNRFVTKSGISKL